MSLTKWGALKILAVRIIFRCASLAGMKQADGTAVISGLNDRRPELAAGFRSWD